MTSMVERVARAMAANDSGPEGSALFDIHWSEFGEGYTRSARAAIEAMKEPGETQLRAAWDKVDYNIDDFWRAMIDAALKE